MSCMVISKKFRGSMIGALLGDCFGVPYEYESLKTPISKTQLQAYFDKLEGPPYKTPQYQYSDDTAMTKSVAESLVRQNGFDAKDMAERFVKEFVNDSRRGYGANIRDVFVKLYNRNLDDVWKPAEEQFDGSGSYGNGGAMRISPVALFAYKNYNSLVEIAEQCTRLTHTHPLGINGAILQAIAVYLALRSDCEKPLDVAEYMKQLTDRIAIIEQKSNRVVQDNVSYQEQLKKVQRLLVMGDKATTHLVVQELGNSVSAVFSVPTSIYCFLRAQQSIPDIETDNPFRRTIQYAISLGGDTDTIASMAGAIAGGFYGIDMINENLQNLAEGRCMIDSLATKLYNQTFA